MVFEQTLLHMVHEKYVRVLDLGWVPYWEPEGHFLLVLIEKTNWEEPLVEFESRDKEAVVERIETLLKLVSAGKL